MNQYLGRSAKAVRSADLLSGEAKACWTKFHSILNSFPAKDLGWVGCGSKLQSIIHCSGFADETWSFLVALHSPDGAESSILQEGKMFL